MAATFVVEDGTGKSDANAYVSVADADQYHENQGNPSTWADVAAVATLHLETQPTDGDTITINGRAYRLKTVIAAADDILIGASLGDTQGNLVDAINLTGDKGTAYHTGTVINVDVSALLFVDDDSVFTAKVAGTAGNVLAISETFTSYLNRWGTLPHTAVTLTGGVDSKEQAIRVATQYMDLMYGPRWLERPTSDEQALHWPRSWIEDGGGFAVGSDVIPQVVKDACSSLALRSLVGTILLPDQVAADRNVSARAVRVGPISKSESFGAGGATSLQKFRDVEALLDEFVAPSGRISRA